ncbi:T9SS type A sorting domain-containing protein [Flavobacterium tyrosinilyticum]|uniref:T9SS type A sorting domain-containing protein n=1 Tax=Flavobacterium tyrosinilyticum TaxID=1658740 RepID=UPI00202EE978|nr:T9SS type A sorting domain-containing protein [Flavobacterium tyrosinilyticum]MCM0665758.1 T9SS type A sorting domain-containing protein [Flavobacterium tyrosinilyticum]
MRTKLLILCLLTVSFAKSQNLLQNGSFEQFTADAPDSWTIIYGATSKEETIKNVGTSSLKATTVSGNIQLKQEFAVSEGVDYTLQFDYYIPGPASPLNIGSLSYEITKVSSNGSVYLDAPMAPLVNKEFGVWKTITYDFKAQFFPGATSATLATYFTASSMYADASIYFDNVIVAKKGTLGTVDFDKKTNPIASMSKDEIKLSNDFKNSSYVIYSIDGKAVKRVNNNSSETIAISGLPNGVYLLKLNDLGTSVKFIK